MSRPIILFAFVFIPSDPSEVFLSLLTFMLEFKSSVLSSNQTLDEILHRKIKYIGYNLNPDFDYLTKINGICAEDILKVSKKYLAKPFLSICGEEEICNKINKLWIKNF